MNKFLVDFGFEEKVCEDGVDYICCLIAAFAHDAGHRGFTNNFYIKTNNKLALDYSYESPLERMHSSILMQLLKKYDKMVPVQNKKWMVRMILATDNMASGQQHKDLVDRQFELSKVYPSKEDQLLLK